MWNTFGKTFQYKKIFDIIFLNSIIKAVNVIAYVFLRKKGDND